MRSRLLRLQAGPSAALRSTLPMLPVRQPLLCLRLQKRFITAKEKPLPEADQPGLGPNQEQLPHVSEEAAATSKITGEAGPDLEQGTPVQEILKRDENSQVKPPKIIQEEIRKSSPKGSRPFSTAARTRLEGLTRSEVVEEKILNQTRTDSEVAGPGHIFGLPELPLPENDRLKQRYHPLILQVTNLLMRDGKKGVAQRNMASILNYLRTAAPPRMNPTRPLLESASSAAGLSLDPIRYLELAIDSVAPLLRLRSHRGAAGGGMALQVPIPIHQRQRRRTAVMWILNAASKKRSKGSGRTQFAHKVAEELIAIVEGRSGLWERRGTLHKQGVSARANMSSGRRRR